MKKLLLSGLAIGALAGSFIAGTRIGTSTHQLWDAQNRASLVAGEMRLMDANDQKLLRDVKNSQLSFWLAEHGKYMDSSLKWLWPYQTSEHAIRSAVQYRIAHPYTDVDLSKPDNWNSDVDMKSSFVQDVVAGQKENWIYMQKVLSEYSRP